jgi:hypothetical protein
MYAGIAAILRIISAIFSVGCATFLMFNNIDGWGWLLLVAVMLGSFEYKSGDSKNES